MAVLLGDILRLRPLDQATLLGGGEGLEWRTVDWVSVIHPPAASFAQRGEFVLTTGAGCRSREFNQFILAVAERDAAGLAVARPPDRDGPLVSDATIAAAEAAQFPILTLDWEVPFASITRAVINSVLEDRYQAQLDGTDRLLDRFSAAVLEGHGLTGLLDEIEACTGAGALVFDQQWALLRSGPVALAHLRDASVAALHRRSRRLEPERRASLDGLLGSSEPVAVTGIEPLGLPAGTGIGIKVRRRPLGFLFLLDQTEAVGPPEFEALDARVLRAGATALALEMMQKHAQSEQVASARDELLWEFIAQSEAPSAQAIERVVGLGLDPSGLYEVLVNADPDADAREASVAALRSSADRLSRSCVELHHDDESVLLVQSEESCVRELLEKASRDDGVAHWGLAASPSGLDGLPRSYRAAQLAVQVATTLQIPGAFADAQALEPFMALSRLAADPAAVAWARRSVDPLTRYDDATGRNLMETLEVYLDEGMNTSASARRLHLNRHSLLYRLRKIEALTDRSLASSADRFILDLSVKLHRFGILPCSEPRQHAPNGRV